MKDTCITWHGEISEVHWETDAGLILFPALLSFVFQGTVESEEYSAVCPVPVVFSRTGPFLCTLDWRCAERLGTTALFNTW